MKYLIIAIATFLLAKPALHPGLFNVYDNVQVTRIQATYHELVSGQLPVRYFSEFGHGGGYMLLKYYSPLVYYLGAGLMAMGFNGVQAVKLIYIIVIAIGSLGMYKLLKKLVRKSGITIGVLAFLSSPYLYHDLYHRGSLTEAAALLISPWVILNLLKLVTAPSKQAIAWASIAIAAVVLAHSLTGLMILGVTILLFVMLNPGIKAWKYLLLAIMLGMGLSAFSLSPAIFERGNIQYESNSLAERGYLDHPVAITEQLWNQGLGEEKSAYLGLFFLLVLTMILAYLYQYKSNPDKNNHRYKIFIWVALISVCALILMDPVSRIVWANLSYIRYLQFPFRLLTIATLVLSIGGALIYESAKKWSTKATLYISLLVPLLLSLGYYQTHGYQYGTTYTVDDPCMTSTWADEYLNKNVKECLKEKPELGESLSDSLEILGVSQAHSGREITIQTRGTGTIKIGKYFESEWEASSGGERLKLAPIGVHGLIGVNVPKDVSEVKLMMTKTIPEQVGDYLSLASFLAVFYLVLARDRATLKLKQPEQKKGVKIGKELHSKDRWK